MKRILEGARRTGRTTRMFQHIAELARHEREVTVVMPTEMVGYATQFFAGYPSVRVIPSSQIRDLAHLNHLLEHNNPGSASILIVDHYVIERFCRPLLTEYHRYDQHPEEVKQPEEQA